MKTALVCTTITPPTILSLYRKYGPDAQMFVACDMKTPGEVFHFCQKIGATCLTPADQAHWKSSELFGWNTIQRRVFALLAAIEWGADVIVSIDTDDFPTTHDHFFSIAEAFRIPFSGLELRTNSRWVDPGYLIEPPTSHRGMPVRLDRFYVHPAIDRQVGVVASTVLGSCDISAMDRLVGTPKRSVASELARSGVIVDPAKSWTLFNSEAIAFRRELAPALMVLPFVGRFDDLFASMIAQRIMRETGHVVRLGPPVVWHEREDRNILKDLKNEVFGMEHIEEFARMLDQFAVGPNERPFAITKVFWKLLSDNRQLGFFSDQTIEAALAFLEDMEGVL